MSVEAIKAAIPHPDQFLLVDEIIEPTGTRAMYRRRAFCPFAGLNSSPPLETREMLA